jgi:hypothetical protein
MAAGLMRIANRLQTNGAGLAGFGGISPHGC